MTSSSTRTVHVVEPGGWGGVHQHAASLAACLAHAGVPVVFHTAADAEASPSAVRRRACFWRFSGLRPRPLRRAAVAAGWVLAGVPACTGRARAGDIVHFEGWFRPALVVPLVLAARLRRCAFSFSPHTTFSRRGRPGEERIVRWLARHAGVVFTFSERDRQRALEWGVSPVPARLLPPPADPDPALVAAWRHRWEATDGRRVALFAGQIRPDKGLDIAVQAASRWEPDLRLAVVGEDVGALAGARRLAGRLGVHMEVDEGYQPLDRLVAALAAADVVVCPYRASSQSLILTLAATLGRPTVAADVGGLGELATAVVPPGDPAALADAVQAVLAAGPVRRAPVARDQARPFLEALGLAARP